MDLRHFLGLNTLSPSDNVTESMDGKAAGSQSPGYSTFSTPHDELPDLTEQLKANGIYEESGAFLLSLLSLHH